MTNKVTKQQEFVPDITAAKSKQALKDAEVYGRVKQVNFKNVSGNEFGGKDFPAIDLIFTIGKRDLGEGKKRIKAGQSALMPLEKAKFLANKLAEQMIREYSKSIGGDGSILAYAMYKPAIITAAVGLPFQGIEKADWHINVQTGNSKEEIEDIGEENYKSVKESSNLLSSFRTSDNEFEEENDSITPKSTNTKTNTQEVDEDDFDEFEDEESEYDRKKKLRDMIKNEGIAVSNNATLEKLEEVAKENGLI